MTAFKQHLHKLRSSKGGITAAANMTPEQRIARAKKAAAARRDKRPPTKD